MSSVRIQVINPNTSLAMTETIGAAAARGCAGHEDPRGLPQCGVCPQSKAILMKPLLP